MNYSALIVAAGKSERFESKINKLLYKLSNGKRVIDSTLSVFLQDEECKQVIVVTNPEVLDYLISHDVVQDGAFDYKPVYCAGGKSRSNSVENGLMAVTEDVVLIHDGARCYLLEEDLQAVKKALETERAAMLVADETDTVKKVDDNGYIICSINRDELKRAQTPQAFRTKDIMQAYRLAIQDDYLATDDAGIIEKYSDIKIKCVKAKGSNEKITTLRDIK